MFRLFRRQRDVPHQEELNDDDLIDGFCSSDEESDDEEGREEYVDFLVTKVLTGVEESSSSMISRASEVVCRDLFRLNDGFRESYKRWKGRYIGFNSLEEKRQIEEILQSHNLKIKDVFQRPRTTGEDDSKFKDLSDDDKMVVRSGIKSFQESHFNIDFQEEFSSSSGMYELLTLPRLFSRLVKYATSTHKFYDFHNVVVSISVDFGKFQDGARLRSNFTYNVNENYNSTIKQFGLEEYYNIVSDPQCIPYLLYIPQLLRQIANKEDITGPREDIKGEPMDRCDKYMLSSVFNLFIIEASRSSLAYILFPMFIDLLRPSGDAESMLLAVTDPTEQLQSASTEPEKKLLKEDRANATAALFAMSTPGTTQVLRGNFEGQDYGLTKKGPRSKDYKKFSEALVDQICNWHEIFGPDSELRDLVKIRDLSIFFQPLIADSSSIAIMLTTATLKNAVQDVRNLHSLNSELSNLVDEILHDFAQFEETKRAITLRKALTESKKFPSSSLGEKRVQAKISHDSEKNIVDKFVRLGEEIESMRQHDHKIVGALVQIVQDFEMKNWYGVHLWNFIANSGVHVDYEVAEEMQVGAIGEDVLGTPI